MSWKSTQTSNIAFQAMVEAMVRTGGEDRELIRARGEVYMGGKVVRKAGSKITEDDRIVDIMSAATGKKGARDANP